MPPTIDGQVTIEKTPSYFVTKAAPERVFNMSSDVRLIVVVRDPVTRAISDYAQAVAKRPDLPPFNRMAFRGDNATSNRHRQGDATSVAMSWGAIKIGLYARHLERWLRYFPPSQMHFVHGERLIGDPAGEMALLQDFLGLRRHVTEKHFYFNATKGFPCIVSPTTQSTPSPLQPTAEKLPLSSNAEKIRLNRKKTSINAFVGSAMSASSSSVASFSSGTDADTDERSMSAVETGSGNVQSTYGGGIRCLGKTKGRAHPIVDDVTLKLLRDFFRPFNEKFYRMTGINFGWP